jgi:hypothetical protein
MFRKVVTYTVLICMLSAMPLGCYSKREVAVADLNPPSPYAGQTIVALVTTEGEVLEFPRDTAPKWNNTTTTIVGTPHRRSQPAEGGGWTKPKRIPAAEREQCRIPLENVRTVYLMTKDHTGTTVVTVVAIAAVTVVIVAIMAASAAASCSRELGEALEDEPPPTSCPYVYSFDGTHYVLEGVPYVGSMCEALAWTDVVALGHLVAVGDEYRVQVLNDGAETEFVDEFVLLVADHEPETELVPDARGGIHVIAERRQPVAVRDQHGHDWHQWLRDKDYLYWEGDPRALFAAGEGAGRDTLFFTFDVPPSATQARLVVSGGHSPWAIGLERELLDLWGSEVGSLYQSFRDPDFRGRFLSWVRREEMTELAVRVKTHDGWGIAGFVSPDRPAADGEHVVVVDLEGVDGDVLEVALAPPAGVWRVNAITADFSDDAAVELQEVAARAVTDQDGADLGDLLDTRDGQYVVQPTRGMHALLSFPVPEPVPGRERTVFAKTTGYYDIHLDAEGPAKTDEIARLENEPGYAAQFAIRYYRRHMRNLALAAR